MTPEEQERVVIAELMGRVELFASTGRSSMPIRLDEMEPLLKYAVAAVSTKVEPPCPHAWEEINPGNWLCKECGDDVDLTRSPDWSPPQPAVNRNALVRLRDDLDQAYPQRAQYDIPSTVIARLDVILGEETNRG